MMRRIVCSLAVVALAMPLHAQDAENQRSDWLLAGTLGVPRFEYYSVAEFFTLGFHMTRAKPGRIGPDLAIATMPRLLTSGALPLIARLGLAYPVATPGGFLLLPSGGLTVLGAVGTVGAGGSLGYNVGLSGVLPSRSRVKLRAGITRHVFFDAETGVWHGEVGLTWRP